MNSIFFWGFGLVAMATTDKPSSWSGSYTCNYIDGLYKGESWMIYLGEETPDGFLAGGMEIAGAQLSQMVELKAKQEKKPDALTFHAVSVEGFGPIPEQVKPDEILFQFKKKKGKIEFVKGVVPDPLKCTRH
ncbi:MAG: hypothetical protein VX278_04425 [Myxococcota bacterium]|nr:hypothetical protein [Myxococcota bacterium]